MCKITRLVSEVGDLTMEYLLTLACLIASVFVGTQALPTNDENRLGKQLVKKYRKLGLRGRPVENSRQLWNVKFGLMLYSVLDVDFACQTMEVIVWESVMWNDPNLKWDKSDYDVDNIGLRPSDVIMPDITLYNAASEMKVLYPNNQLVVYSSGDVNYIPRVRQSALCSLAQGSHNITCTLKYGSWIHNGDKMNLTLNDYGFDMSLYQANPFWELTATSAKRNTKLYECCPEEYIDLTFDITLTRK